MNHDSRIPVILALSHHRMGGVFAWAIRLKKAFAGHPRYRLMLMEISEHSTPCAEFDFQLSTMQKARDVLRKLPGSIVAPNYLFPLSSECAALVSEGMDIHCLGICHSNSDSEYLLPLAWHEPVTGQFMAVSSESARNLAQYMPLRAGDIAVLPYGIPLPAELRRSWRTAPIRLVYAGRIVQLQKRVMDFVPLVQALLRARADFVFDIIGDGLERVALQQAMAGCAHNGRVRFVPHLPPDQMDAVWDSHDVFVQVSDYEGTSISMLEAMAHGTVPVVTDAKSGIEGNVLPGRNGFVVAVGDMEAMAKIIADLAQDPERLERLGRAAWEKAKEFSMESYVAKFSAILDRTLAGPRRSWPLGDPRPDFFQRQEALIEEIRCLRRDVERYRNSLHHILNKPPIRAYRAIRRWLGRPEPEDPA